jgi:hypothetical protein
MFTRFHDHGGSSFSPQEDTLKALTAPLSVYMPGRPLMGKHMTRLGRALMQIIVKLGEENMEVVVAGVSDSVVLVQALPCAST